jgi:hypothetical protein
MTTIPTSRPRSGGCLKGCLLALALLLLPALLAGGYGAWFLWQGFRNNPTLVAVGELVRRDGIAEAVLGEDIHITGVAGNAFSFVPGLGARSAYVVGLTGSKASGTLAIESHIQSGQVRIDSMILSGPDGERYDLMHHLPVPSRHGPTTSI